MNAKSTVVSLLAVLLIVGTALSIPRDQPNMTAALGELQTAKSELTVAEHNKGGHRAKALQLVNQAIKEVNLGIEYDRKHNHASTTLNEVLAANPDQPHMQSALDHLNGARDYLVKANADKGGHRAKALDLIKTAIDEVKAGIAAG